MGFGCRNTLMTMGKRGQRLFTESGESYTGKAKEIQAIDTMGAGDSFFAAFLTGLLKRGWKKGGRIMEEMAVPSLREAAEYSAKNCLVRGSFDNGPENNVIGCRGPQKFYFRSSVSKREIETGKVLYYNILRYYILKKRSREMNELDASSIVPLYKQLKELILDDIKKGKLKPNQKIPTEQELSEKYQISRITVRKALAQLVDEEVLARKQGKGTYVQEPKIISDLNNGNSFTNLCRRNGKVPGGRTLQLMLTEPSDRDIRELQLEPGEQVIHIQRLRTADNEPVMLENIYFPGHLKNILTEDLDDKSLYEVLREKYGLRDGDFKMEIGMSECTGQEASLLEVRSGTPLMLVRELIYDQYNRPLHRTKSLLRGDKMKYITIPSQHH